MDRAAEEVAAAATLPVETYTAGEAFQREKRTLFCREWLPFCAAGQLAQRGSFVNHTLGGWPVMAVRGADGTLRAFHNVCRHQGMPVVDKPTGQCDRLRCRFHGWTYDLTGALIDAPAAVAPKDPGSEQHRLRGVGIAVSEIVFVRIEGSEGAPPGLDLDGTRFATAITTDADCNWKSLVEMLLAGEGWRYLWPTGFEAALDGGRAVRQVLPRSFARTRIVDLVFTGDGAAPAPLLEAIRDAAAADRQEAETRQAILAAGGDGPVSAAVAAFRARLIAASRR